MSSVNTLMYKGRPVGWVYVDFDPRLNKAIQGNLAWNMVDMHVSGDDLRDIKNGGYEAQITKGNYVSMGMFTGPLFRVEIETDRGKSKLAFMLVQGVHDPSMN